MTLSIFLSATFGEKPTPAFHLFPQLPLEIREMIWEAVDQEPRTITIYHQHPWRSSQTHQDRGPLHVESPNSAPPLFFVSTESRRVLLRHHNLKLLRQSTKPIYINVGIDNILVGAYGTWPVMRCTFLIFAQDVLTRPDTLADGNKNPLFSPVDFMAFMGRDGAVKNYAQQEHLYHCRAAPGVACDCHKWWRKVNLKFLGDPAPGMIVLHGILLIGAAHVMGRVWKATHR